MTLERRGKRVRAAVTLAVIAALALAGVAGLAHADLAGRIDKALASESAKKMKIGIHVTLLPEGRVLYADDEDAALIPASNVKVITTASALFHLTPEFSFHTIFWADGQVFKNGWLKGDLVIQGDGDPNMSGRFYDGDVSCLPRKWAGMLRKRGITHVTGDIVANDTIFDRQYTCPTWPADQLHRWYAAPVGGLSFNDNCVNIILRPSQNGKPARIALEPDTDYLTISNKLMTTSSRATAEKQGYSVSRKTGSNHVVVRGAYYSGNPSDLVYVTVNEPPMYFATVLSEEMRRAGITIGGKVRLAAKDEERVTTKDPRALIVHTSDLRTTLAVTNKQSQSFYAEQLLKRTGAARFGQGTFTTGVKAAAEFLEKAGIEPGSYVLGDGGGLSRTSRLSARQFTTVLGYVYNSQHGKDFVESLSLAGIDHTLRKRLKGADYRGKIAAKTGTLDGVAALSGYAFNNSGKVLAFSILANDTHGNWVARAIMDEICRAMIDEEVP
jgi:D-alanyl-D-alanine carboxypeptidase/D-alanyl-D-alanine-endopeptidase (penicillin-binding protein 4)